MALAAARNLGDTELAALLGIDKGTLSRKKNGRSGWGDKDAMRAVAALGDDIDGLIADLERLRATRQYQQAHRADTTTTGHVA